MLMATGWCWFESFYERLNSTEIFLKRHTDDNILIVIIIIILWEQCL